MQKRTAWFGEHPAEGVDCPSCGARVGGPCRVTISMPGTCVSSQMAITGLHVARLREAEHLRARLAATKQTAGDA